MDHALSPPREEPQHIVFIRRALFLGAWVALLVVVMSKASGCGQMRHRVTTMQRVQDIEKALARYSIDNCGSVPTTAQGLDALRTAPDKKPLPVNWHGPYLASDEMLNDDWGRRFQYVAPGGLEPDTPGVDPISRAYDLWSLGADGREGGTGVNASVRSWEAHTPAQ